ncbi:MAG: phosphonoacetaldehyde hydrolase, partial [Rhizobiaceae bacterium]|nr:phosphonoacetaldehyde hydrolase [Rhizobiaceae bacterium]
CWTVGVALSGNEAGLTVEEANTLPAEELSVIRERATASLKAHGAHYVIDTVADLLPVIDDIQRRIDKGERP